MDKFARKICYLLCVFLVSSSAFSSPEIPPQSSDDTVANKAAIASAHPVATQAGIDILQSGGNAFDAAIAVTATLAVVEPYSSGIGGGGFYLLHQAVDDRYVMIDAREKAPLRAHKDLYLDQSGDVIPGASINGALSAGIPGIPAALVHLAENYGVLPLSQTLMPAIKAAREGFKVDEYYQRMTGFRLEALRKNPAASAVFLDGGEIPAVDFVIKQPDLANTLQTIASDGFSGFYENALAWKMVRDVRKHGGIWTMKDMATYEIVERSPEVVVYKGMKVTSATLPSSGGLVISEILRMLSEVDIEKMDEVQRVHYIAEAMRRAYRDRAEYMGDPDFIEVPVDYLISEFHIKLLAASISRHAATPSDTLKPVAQPSGQGTDTTHFSVIDRLGNKVSATLSINYPFGSCFVAEGSGVLLNDEMDDFVSKPGEPNVYGLVGSHANAIEPGKRMLSSMSPSIVETQERIAVIGTPGGSRIITMVLLGLLNFFDGQSAEVIVNAGRYHHQYLPDEISYEPGVLGEEVVEGLQKLGHSTRELDSEYGNMQVIVLDKNSGEVQAASDSRGVGSAQVLH